MIGKIPRFRIGLLCTALLLQGCATSSIDQSADMKIGNDMTYISLSEQREAVMGVKLYDSIPNDAAMTGVVETSRCHRDTADRKPTDDNLIIDLKVAAWARGANGIGNVQTDSESAILKNCWYVVTAIADSFVVEVPEAP